MAEKRKNHPGKIRLVFQRSNILTKCVVLTALTFSIAALLTIRGQLLQVQEETDALRHQAAALEQKNSELEQSIADLDTVEGIARIAQDELGLAYPDITVFIPD